MPKYEEQAKVFCDAIRHFSQSEQAIDNLECYLSYHFPVWMEKYANTPDGLAGELKNFAHMFDAENELYC